VQLGQAGALRDLPREGVLAAAGADDQNLHEPESRAGGGCFK
jgi:hypothetical protein